MTLVALWKYRIHIALIAIAIGAFFYLQDRDGTVRKAERQACELEQATAIIKGVNDARQKKNEVRRLDDDDLVRRYCSSSVFDVPVEECIRSNPLLR